MRTRIKLQLIPIVVGLWLLLIQPVHAFDVRSCHLPVHEKHSSFLFSHWLSARSPLAAPSDIEPMTRSTSIPSDWAVRCFGLSGQAGIAACRCAIAANPRDAAAWNNLGQKLFRLQRYTDALVAYDHALLIHPNYSLGLANRCGVLSQLGEYDQALASCDLALAGDGHWGVQGSALAWDNRGDALFNLKRYSEALSSFERALHVNPNYFNAQRNRAIVLQQLEQNSEQNPELRSSEVTTHQSTKLGKQSRK